MVVTGYSAKGVELMPSCQGFGPQQLAEVKTTYSIAWKAVEACVKSAEGTGRLGVDAKFDATFSSVTGNIPARVDVTGNGERARQILIETIKAMNARVASVTFRVGMWVHDAGLANANQRCYPITTRMGALPLTIGPSFFNEPLLTLYTHSKAQTLLRELSHHAVGTIDNPLYEQVGGGWAGAMACGTEP